MGQKLKQGKKKMPHELFCFWFFQNEIGANEVGQKLKKVQILGTSYIPKNVKFWKHFVTLFYSP